MSDTVLILNPKSGTGEHETAVRKRAELLGYDLRKTEAAGDGVSLAASAAEDGASTIVAAGGDGTINEVVRGIHRADAFDQVTLGVVPVGTGNNCATQIGVPDVDAGFDVVEHGERRRIDVGLADGRPFVNSCIAGLTADSSGETSPEMKSRFGVLAYVITTLRSVAEFDTVHLTVETAQDTPGTDAWRGEAICVLVGNGRRFATGSDTQANMEDGQFEVAVVEDAGTLDLMSDAVVDQLLGEDSSSIERLRASTLTVTVNDPETIRFSLDGEITQERSLTIETRPAALSLAVGDGYDPNPNEARFR
jgi:YegS/Rv2252/BmrU family lipid kinase